MGELDPGPSGLGLDPEKGGFLPNLSHPRVLGQGGCVMPFQNLDEAKKMLGAEF